MMEGWKEIEIKGKKIRTCGLCQWYFHKLVKSGNNPIYANICKHSDANNGYLKIPPFFQGNLDINTHGYVEPAEWCPYTERIERELKINSIINDNN